MELYLEGTEPDEEQLVAAIRRATIASAITPVLCGSAFKNKGVQPMLDAIVDFLPSPVDIPAIHGHSLGADAMDIERHADPAEPFSALAFKIMSDQHLGKLTYLRIYSGTLKAGTAVLNSTKDRKERIGKIYQMHANKREERPTAMAGQIVAVMGLKDTTTGDTLCDPAKPVILESMTFPAPVINVAIEPRTKGDQDKLGIAIQRLAEEDPTFQVRTDEETGQTIIAGMGELHLEVLVDRMRREFKVEANIGRPQVAYRETVRRKVEKVEYTHKKQTGGSGQFGRVIINLEPTGGDGGGYEFENKVTGGRIPREYIPSVDAGCQEAAEFGVLAGYPMVDVKVTLTDGAYHEVDSSELAFKIAGSMAFKKAAAQADPVLLEPVMAVEVTTPEDYMGEVIGDLNSRRGQIQAMEERTGVTGGYRPRAAVRDVRLRGRPAQPDPGPGELQHAVRLVCRGPAQHRQGDHRQGTRRVVEQSARSSTAIAAGTRAPDPHDSGDRSQRGDTSGEGQVPADQAARQHRHHRAYRPREDHSDRGDHQGAARQVPRREHRQRVRPDRQREGREGARDHDLDLARRVPDGEAPLRAC